MPTRWDVVLVVDVSPEVNVVCYLAHENLNPVTYHESVGQQFRYYCHTKVYEILSEGFIYD